MGKSWQARTLSSRTTREEREAIADTLVDGANTIISDAHIRLHPTLSAYQRYSGHFLNRNSDFITEHERYQCHAARDQGAALLIHIIADQLAHVVPRSPHSDRGLFAQADKEALNRVCSSMNALKHDAYHLHAADKHHGQRYRTKALAAFEKCESHAAALRAALDDIVQHTNPKAPHAAEEKILLTYCTDLLDVVETCRAHAVATLRSPQAKMNGR